MELFKCIKDCCSPNNFMKWHLLYYLLFLCLALVRWPGWHHGQRTFRALLSTSCWTQPQNWREKKTGWNMKLQDDCTNVLTRFVGLIVKTGNQRRWRFGNEQSHCILLTRYLASLDRALGLIKSQVFQPDLQ